MKYEPYKIPDRQQMQRDDPALSMSETKPSASISADEALFYEIEYDSGPMPGVGKYVLKSQKIEPPEIDEIRELFNQMRDIARKLRSSFDYSRFFERRVHHDNSIIFYKQGMFMKDFSDNYTEQVAFSSYFPYYQMMGYEQLRTYFTWRTEVRKGNVTDTSLSYAFLYIYELLNNIGVDSPQDGLDYLMFFWKEFRGYNKIIDKYVLRWLKDYHIYYELPQSFKEFVDCHDLAMHYPKMVDSEDNFDMFSAISKYDIRKSAFFVEDKVKLITDCFYFVRDRLRKVCMEHGIDFEKAIFQPTKKLSAWTPFKDALFYQCNKQSDRQVILSEKEIYVCNHNSWTFSTVLTSESSRQLIGYLMKLMESILRKATKYKYKLSANINTITHPLINKLNEAGVSLENVARNAVLEFYKEETKTVVKVDYEALSKIRMEALATQEKLIVPEQEEMIVPAYKQGSIFDNKPVSMPDVWTNFKHALTSTEIQALSVVLHGDVDLKKFADECGIMLEVLVDGINEKAMDSVGDNVMDEEFVLYDDYKEQIKELVG